MLTYICCVGEVYGIIKKKSAQRMRKQGYKLALRICDKLLIFAKLILSKIVKVGSLFCLKVIRK